jgi:hypothetical protein
MHFLRAFFPQRQAGGPLEGRPLEKTVAIIKH